MVELRCRLKLLLFFSIKSICILLFISCTNHRELTIVTHLPKTLKEASGIEISKKEGLFWMINDSGNPNKLYQVNTKGKIKRKISIAAKNKDWEDLTSDDEGNLYIGDFGNNFNTRKDLVILKIEAENLKEKGKKKVSVKKIKFSYENQKKFPQGEKALFFDAESLFYNNEHLYIFTKSRVKNNYGKTSLYKIPAKEGVHTAMLISEFETCSKARCWITSAAISPNKKTVVLLNHTSIWVFTNFSGDDFFSGKATEIPLGFNSQKESICFKNNETVYITDEKSRGKGGKLYRLTLPPL